MQESGDTRRAVRRGSALTWRPQTRTTALLIGGFFLYFVAVTLRSVPNLASQAAGNCVGPADFSGYTCQEPSWARSLATVELVLTAAELAVVGGAALAFAGRRAGRTVMLGALLGAAIAEIAAIAVAGDAGTRWQAGVSAVGALVLCGLVASLSD